MGKMALSERGSEQLTSCRAGRASRRLTTKPSCGRVCVWVGAAHQLAQIGGGRGSEGGTGGWVESCRRGEGCEA